VKAQVTEVYLKKNKEIKELQTPSFSLESGAEHIGTVKQNSRADTLTTNPIPAFNVLSERSINKVQQWTIYLLKQQQ
jgi:hypothetical protein